MAYDLTKLKGEFKERNQELAAKQMSALDMTDDTLKVLNKGFDPLDTLGIVMGEDGKVPKKDDIPRIFIMQADQDGVEKMKSLDDAGLKLGSREFWLEAQKGNIFAYPGGSEKPVQLSADIQPFARPKVRVSAPVDMHDARTVSADQNYRKPGGFVRFINSIFSGFRRRDCEIYRERQKMAQMSEKRKAGMAAENAELKEAQKTAAVKAEKAAQKKEMDDLAKSANYKTHGKEFYRDLVAPTPKFHAEHEKEPGGTKGHYTREQFNTLEVIDKKVEDYSIGGKPLSLDEYCGLVGAFSHDAKFSDTVFRQASGYEPTRKETLMNMGYTEKQAQEQIMRCCSTFVTDDQMKGDLRDSQGECLETAVNPARKLVFEALDKYKEGDKAPLAEKIAFEIKNLTSGTSEINGTLSNGARNHIDFSAKLVDLMDRDPQLKQEAMKYGLKEEDIDAAKGLAEYSKAAGAREDAKAEIAKAIYEDRELSAEDKKKYATAIVKANLIEAKIFVENAEFGRSGKTKHAEIERLQAEAVKNGLKATQKQLMDWEQNPEKRPVPPKGKFYYDQVPYIVEGIKENFNEHPDTVIQLSDPENAASFTEIAEEVVAGSGLDGLDNKELLNALHIKDNAYKGASLVDKAGKAAEQIHLRELGLDQPAAQKQSEKNVEKDLENDPLNTAFDLGHKAPKDSPMFGGPTA